MSYAIIETDEFPKQCKYSDHDPLYKFVEEYGPTKRTIATLMDQVAGMLCGKGAKARGLPLPAHTELEGILKEFVKDAKELQNHLAQQKLHKGTLKD
ncbi:MAG: hypothetical protein OEY79_01945 [Anaplasmataceae bacterium]|nr:hypothetical protein [Anaplasmataceae bacterium]